MAPYYMLGAYNRIWYQGKNPEDHRLVAISKTNEEGRKIVEELRKLLRQIEKEPIEEDTTVITGKVDLDIFGHTGLVNEKEEGVCVLRVLLQDYEGEDVEITIRRIKKEKD